VLCGGARSDWSGTFWNSELIPPLRMAFRNPVLNPLGLNVRDVGARPTPHESGFGQSSKQGTGANSSRPAGARAGFSTLGQENLQLVCVERFLDTRISCPRQLFQARGQRTSDGTKKRKISPG